jgi:DNA replication and repair protein RecF
MQVEHLSLKNFRNYARLEVSLPTSTILLHGQNAQGKTNFLEALYYLATSSSPYATSDRQLINWRAEQEAMPFAQISADILLANRAVNRLSITLVREEANTPSERFKKEIRLNGVIKRRVDILGLLTVVLFLPQDLVLVEGSPQHRRHYMNTTLEQVNAAYNEALMLFEKVLTQRNALLKQIGRKQAKAHELDYWDDQLTRSAGVIIAERQKFLREIEVEAARVHRELTNQAEDLKLAYVPSFEPTAAGDGQLSFAIPGLDLHRQISAEQIAPQYLAALQANQREEIERGMTLFGPQRDDLRFYVNGRDLSLYGSRGQARTAVMAVKLAELAWMQQKMGEAPLLLLDEVISELDEQRRAYLLDRVRGVPQAVLTTTEPNIFTPTFLETATLWQVRAGQIDTLEKKEG